MHCCGVVHLDLKPANILLDKHNRVRVTDFGCALDLESADAPASIGSPDYVSPEVLAGERPTAAADLWAFGCIVCAVFTGQSPFHGHTLYDTFERIRIVRYQIPDFVPRPAADLVRKLLVRRPEDRLGAGQCSNGYAPIKEEPFFRGVDWDTLPSRRISLIAFPPAVANREREMSEKIAADFEREEIVHVTKVAIEGKEAELGITDMARIVLRVEGKVVAATQISNELTLAAEGGVLTFGNGKAVFAVEMDEADTCQWIELIHEVINDD
jgi:serine/threonine protein kinase